MTVQITINVPDETYQLAHTVAEMNDPCNKSTPAFPHCLPINGRIMPAASQ